MEFGEPRVPKWVISCSTVVLKNNRGVCQVKRSSPKSDFGLVPKSWKDTYRTVLFIVDHSDCLLENSAMVDSC